MEALFKSESVIARYVPGALPTAIVVTFDSYTDNAALDRPGFGEAMFATARVPAIHVISRTNDWYQYDEMPAVLAAIASVTASFQRVLAYGSSMGGYAAIRFGDAVGANRVLALSPQYSIDPAKVPWETRWEEARRIRFNEAARIACKAKPVIVYDPRDLDRRHVEMIGGDITIEKRALPYAGHPCGGFLAEAGVARQIALRMLEAHPQIGTLLAKARRERGRSPRYFSVLSERSRSEARAIRWSAIAAQVPNPAAKLRHATLLRRAGRHEEAIAFNEEAARLSGRHPAYLIEWSDTLACAGLLDAAVPLAIEAAEASPHVAYRQHWASHILHLAGCNSEASAFNGNARMLDPTNELYARMAEMIG